MYDCMANKGVQIDQSPRDGISRRVFLAELISATIVLAVYGDKEAQFTNLESVQTTETTNSAEIEVTNEPTTTTTELPTTTTTEPLPVSREILPEQRLGLMHVEISGEGAVSNNITHQLFADNRDDQQLAAGHAVDAEHTPTLDRGFMWHRDSFLPGWSETVIAQDNPELSYPTIIAGHRITQINDPEFGSTVLLDIDKIIAGDRLTLQLDDGTTAVYEAVSNEAVVASDIESLSRIFTSTSAEERLALYACHPAGQATHRFFVHYIRVK